MSKSKKVEQFLEFWQEFLTYSQKEREECLDAALESLKLFKNGRPSQEGQELYDFLTSKDLEFIGMVPNIYYFRVNSTDKQDLKSLWVHPFSLFTMAFKHRKLPLIILSNANLEYNKSILQEIEGNDALDILKGIRGITG